MPFKILENGEPFGSPHFKSFWLFHAFEVPSANSVVSVKQMYLAVYFSETSLLHDMKRPTRRPAGGALNSYEIQDNDDANIKLKINNASLVESRLIEYSNEIGRLHLFQCTHDVANSITPDTWVEAGGWNPPYTNPTTNKGDDPFLGHKVTFDSCADRHVDGVMLYENNNLTESVSIVLPFLQGSIFASILNNHGQQMPSLQLDRNPERGSAGAWTYFDTTPLPGDVHGFSMIAQGAFQAFPFTPEIAAWDPHGNRPASSVIMDRLSSVVHRSSSFSRTLGTARITNKTSVDSTGVERPLEVLHVFNLNENAEVPVVV